MATYTLELEVGFHIWKIKEAFRLPRNPQESIAAVLGISDKKINLA